MLKAIVLTVCYFILYVWSIVTILVSVKTKKKTDIESPQQFFDRLTKDALLAVPIVLASMITSFIQVCTLWAEVLK